MDYRKFLGKVELEVLPYFGGGTVDAPSRRLRVATPVQPGWWRFEVQGRTATAKEPAGPEGLEALPRVRGHMWGARLVREGAVAEPLELLPEEEPPRLAPVCARRWHDGSLVFDGLEFEGEAEDGARRALEEGQSLSGVKGVGAPLRAAFGYALLEAASRALNLRFAPAEVRTRVLAVAEGGRAEAEVCLVRLAAEREAYLREQARRAAARASQERVAEARRVEPEAEARWAAERTEVEERARIARLVTEAQRNGGRARQGRRHGREDSVERAEQALHKAGARLRDARWRSATWLEVTYVFMGERFISIVEADSLRVVDAGVCLAGADSRVTLESLPAVIREAIDEGVLVITRHD